MSKSNKSMSKKLLKYGKFLLSMALIFCMVLPSYATLSATDGSSFVTKAEFDSALADFNSRLTSFEAGINSKIDSQVTSFLDRNGIWAGKKQDTYDLSVVYKDVCNACKTFWTKAFTDPAGRHFGLFEDVIIDEVNKNGLCFFETQWAQCWSVNWKGSYTGYWAYLGTGVGIMDLGIYEETTPGTSVWKSLSVIDNFINVGSQTYGGTWTIVSADKSKFITQFFVKSKQKIYARVSLLWEGTSAQSAGTWTINTAGCTINNVGSKGTGTTTPLGIYNDAVVY